MERNNDSIDNKLQYKRIIGLINHKIELDFHKNIAKRQRCSYNTLRKDIEFLKKAFMKLKFSEEMETELPQDIYNILLKELRSNNLEAF